MQSRTNKMSLVWSRQHTLYKTSGVTHVNQDGCQSAMTLWFRRETTQVRADTSGKETHQRYLCTHDQNSRDCRVGPPTDRLLGKFPTCQQGCQDPYQETQKGGVHHSQGVTEAGCRPLLRQPSCGRVRPAVSACCD